MGITKWDTLSLEALSTQDDTHEMATSRVQPSVWYLKHAHLPDLELLAKFRADEAAGAYAYDYMVPYRFIDAPSGPAQGAQADDSESEEDEGAGAFQDWQRRIAQRIAERQAEFESVAVTIS